MQHRTLCLVASIIALTACGGESKTPAADTSRTSAPATTPGQSTPATPAPAAAAAPVAITGKTHEVRMIGDAKGYRYEPATITIKAGDGIRWIMVSGGPHNVSFWADSIPAGAAAQLTGAMEKQISPLAGALLLQSNETYTISFGNAPKGTYHYFCTPHLALNMKGTITVQ
jgi:plastocyanin